MHCPLDKSRDWLKSFVDITLLQLLCPFLQTDNTFTQEAREGVSVVWQVLTRWNTICSACWRSNHSNHAKLQWILHCCCKGYFFLFFVDFLPSCGDCWLLGNWFSVAWIMRFACFCACCGPGTEFVVLPAFDGKIQFFNANSNGHSRFLDVSRQNVIYNKKISIMLL